MISEDWEEKKKRNRELEVEEDKENEEIRRSGTRRRYDRRNEVWRREDEELRGMKEEDGKNQEKMEDTYGTFLTTNVKKKIIKIVMIFFFFYILIDFTFIISTSPSHLMNTRTFLRYIPVYLKARELS